MSCLDPRRLAALAVGGALLVIVALTAGASDRGDDEPPADRDGTRQNAALPPTAEPDADPDHAGRDEPAVEPTPQPTVATGDRPTDAAPSHAPHTPGVASGRTVAPVSQQRQREAVVVAAAWVAAFVDADHPDRLATLREHSSPALAHRLAAADLPAAAGQPPRITASAVTAAGDGRVGVRVTFALDPDAGSETLEVVVGWHHGRARIEELRL